MVNIWGLTPRSLAMGWAAILARNRLRQEFGLGDRPDNPVMITLGHKKYWHCAGHNNGVKYGFMTVSIDDHNVVICYIGVPDNFIGGGCAVRDKKEMISTKDAGGVLFGGSYCAGVVEQLPQFVNGITDISPQHVFAKKLMKHLPYRALQKATPPECPGQCQE